MCSAQQVSVDRPDHSRVSALLRPLSRWSGATMGTKPSLFWPQFCFLSVRLIWGFYIKNKAAVPPVCRHCCQSFRWSIGCSSKSFDITWMFGSLDSSGSGHDKIFLQKNVVSWWMLTCIDKLVPMIISRPLLLVRSPLHILYLFALSTSWARGLSRRA